MKTTTFRALLASLVLVSASQIASASQLISFASQPGSDPNPMGDTLTYTSGGITVTETAWYVSNTSSSTKFATAAVDAYNTLGLGVCNAGQGANCASPYHQIDNSSGVEFVLLQFSTPVNVSQIDLYDYQAIGSQANVNMTYYTAQTALSTMSTNTTLGSLGTGTTVNTPCPGNNCVGVVTTDNVSTGTVSYLLIGASVPDSGTTVDEFKLNGVVVSTAIPEPSTFWMMLGLSATILIGRTVVSRKRQSLCS